MAQHKFRLRFVHCVRSTFEAMRQTQNNAANATEQVATARNQLKALEEEMRQYLSKNDEFVKDLLADLTGQVDQAITREDWFKKWGVHFLPSLTRKFIELFRKIYRKIFSFRCTSSSIL